MENCVPNDAEGYPRNAPGGADDLSRPVFSTLNTSVADHQVLPLFFVPFLRTNTLLSKCTRPGLQRSHAATNHLVCHRDVHGHLNAHN